MMARASTILELLASCAAALCLAMPASVLAAEPKLAIDMGTGLQQFERSALLQRPEVRTIEVEGDAAYHRHMQYRALPLSALVGELKTDADVQFTATDGFVANVPARLLAGTGQPWLAIEPADTPWPALKPGGASAGPFYLVWLAPGKAGISPEQWPYQIAKIATALPLVVRYPQIAPKNVAADSPAQRGLQVYSANCASCHPINGAGDAAVGPDLNLPHSPTEYLQEPYLRKLIRNPASVRSWKQSAMPGFAADVLSDAQIDDLLAYLRQMTGQRP
jgi:mono/diheme cytochrome c family protein